MAVLGRQVRDVAVAPGTAAAGRSVLVQIVVVGEAPVFGNRPIVLGVAVQILMAGAAVGVIHEAPRLRLDFPPVERHAAARRGVYPQVFGPQPRFGRQHTDDVGARNVALHAFDGVAPRILRVGGKRQLLLMHPHFVTGQTERRR